MALPDEVLTLLLSSIEKHRNAYVLRYQRVPATAELQAAYGLRKDAHALDPLKTAPAWELERKRFFPAIDTALMAFYFGKLGP